MSGIVPAATSTDAAAVAADAANVAAAASTESAESNDGSEDSADLGDAGKKALDAMKAQRNAERDKRKAIETELENLRREAALKDKPAEEAALERVRQDALKEATSKANERILKSEVRAEAKGKLSDPEDAFRYLDISKFEVDANGNFDQTEIAEAINDLLTKKPYLAAKGANQVTFDTGAGKPAPKGQITREQLKGMKSSEIVAARKDGRLSSILGG